MSNFTYRLGVDIGSTTAKMALVDSNNQLLFSEYKRHNTYIHDSLVAILNQILQKFGDIKCQIQITGSAGMGVAEKFNLSFIQEVVASSELVRAHYPEVHTLIDIGGEDSKMIFFFDDKAPDIRMNGSCAGGTGAFIDQMASLMNVEVSQMSDLAANSDKIFPIASRCGVFAKTDIQNLIARKISKENIAASIFQAVAMQTMNTLARGYEIKEKLIFSGGPFSFIPELKKIFIRNIGVDENNVIDFNYPELVPAMGAAYSANKKSTVFSIRNLIANIQSYKKTGTNSKSHRLAPLFDSQNEFKQWKASRNLHQIEEVNIASYQSNIAYLGVDSGSTTTKIVVIGENNEILFKFYSGNKAQVLETVKNGLQEFFAECKKYNKSIEIKASTATGYGEDLVKAAFGLDYGVVETIAHAESAKYLNPKVSFLMDIGGQDMKAIFLKEGVISRIELNESCSSGCGSFIETFGKNLGYPIDEFANLACESQAPCDLGTRCTVFMNSKVKQALRENANISDISAGLSISVIKNAIFKVLKLKDFQELGDHIVVQGGTFKNKSVVRALEQLTGKEVINPSSPEHMGAYGAAIIAKKNREKHALQTSFTEHTCNNVNSYTTRMLTCKACENHCDITKFKFDNGLSYYSGNKCEKYFSNSGEKSKLITHNIYEYKTQLLFDRSCVPDVEIKNGIKIGIPRVLNMYSNYPFWNKLLTSLGFEVVLSDVSTMQLYKKGQGTIMSDSICFPAKLVHGHVMNLIEKKVDRIFYPFVLFEEQDDNSKSNSFNCPIVTSYAEVIKSSINPKSKYGIPVDAPTVNFNNKKLLKKTCVRYLKKFNFTKKQVEKAIQQAQNEQDIYKQQIKNRASEIIQHSKDNDQFLVVLAGRPYHVDALINHKTPQIFSDLGVNVISEDSVPDLIDSAEYKVLTQWAYPNRLYNAATWVSKEDFRTQFVMLNSFGCGPDAIAMDECADILNERAKNSCLLRVDEITSTGSIKLRLRSFIESVKMKNQAEQQYNPRVSTPGFYEKDSQRLILAPYFARVYSEMLESILNLAGYNYKTLPLPDKKSVEYGLKYANNEICYPATIVVGDVIKAVVEGSYNTANLAFAITQTGGQCRATSYMSLIKKALISSGNGDIPVVSFNAGTGTENSQPGFKINWMKYSNHILYGMIFGDALNLMYNSTVVREKNKGNSKYLLDKYIQLVDQYLRNEKPKKIFHLLRQAVEDFNSVEIVHKQIPKVGIVGEIYVKLNSFGHGHIIEWLQDQKIEVVVPPLVDFFVQEFVNSDINKKAYLYDRNLKTKSELYLFEKMVRRVISKAEKIMHGFRFNIKMPYVREALNHAKSLINPAVNTFGEGWLIPAEIADFSNLGINNVISVQPFGCIANQIIAKGVEKTIKEKYPKVNLLFLDFDDGASEVNVLNRLHFMVKNIEYEYV